MRRVWEARPVWAPVWAAKVAAQEHPEPAQAPRTAALPPRIEPQRLEELPLAGAVMMVEGAVSLPVGLGLSEEARVSLPVVRARRALPPEARWAQAAEALPNQVVGAGAVFEAARQA